MAMILKSVGPARGAYWVRDGLHSVRVGLEEKLDSALAEGLKAGQYVAEIGRILGL